MKSKIRNYAELDKSVRWKYKEDWLDVAYAHGYNYISELLFMEAEKGTAQVTIARWIGVHKEAVNHKYKRFDIKTNPPGGDNNYKNRSGIFRYRIPHRTKIQSFVAGSVTITSRECIYLHLRCAECNKTLSGDDWINHKDVFNLIRWHIEEGCDEKENS